jgi:hypothetical protein
MGLLFTFRVKYDHGEPWWNNIDRRKLLIHLPELSDNPTSSHIVANEEKFGEGNDEFGLWNIFVDTSQLHFMCHKMLRHVAVSFSSLLNKGMLQIFITLKNPLPQPGLNSQTLGPIASLLTISPPR